MDGFVSGGAVAAGVTPSTGVEETSDAVAGAAAGVVSGAITPDAGVVDAAGVAAGVGVVSA